MKITCEFESYEEFTHFVKRQEAQEAPKASQTKKSASPAEKVEDDAVVKPQQAPTPMPEPEPAAEPETAAPAPQIDESYRVSVRKTLADLNKKVGKNEAKELISSFGVAKLTDVPLEELPALMAKAKEALNA